MAQLGALAGELALGGLAESARRWWGGSEVLPNVLVTRANAERVVRRLSTLRGAAMKFGQILSLEGDNRLPSEVTSLLGSLRADGHAMPDAQLRRVLGHAYGKGWEARFREFRMDPVAAASIGQVHYAVTADGREVALKVQYPGVVRSIDSDVDNLASLVRLSRLVPGSLDVEVLVAEAKRQLHREADYRAEAEHMRRFAALLGDDEAFVLPRVYDDLTTTHVLGMDFMRGLGLDELVSQPQGVRNRVGRNLYRLFFRELLEFGCIQTDPNLGNFFFVPEGERLALLDFGATRELPDALSAAYARLLGATLQRNRGAVAAAVEEIGFVDRGTHSERVDGLVDFFLIACEPFRHRGAFDFAKSDLPPRVRAAGMALTQGVDFHRTPPPDTIFVHRKLAGTFLLCARLAARVDVREVLESALSNGGKRR